MPEIQNDYYSIAVNDYQFLAAALHTRLYNQISVQCQQIAEKLLKSVAEEVCTVQVEDLLKSHNLKKICQSIHDELPSFQLDIRDNTLICLCGRPSPEYQNIRVQLRLDLTTIQPLCLPFLLLLPSLLLSRFLYSRHLFHRLIHIPAFT